MDAQHDDLDDFELPPPSLDAEQSEELGGAELAAGASSGAFGGGDSKRWLASLDRCIRAIVSIRLLSVRAFDGNGASFSVATGFVVDQRRGIILTNRHVVTPGPVVADAIFLNKEEVDLVPIYRCVHFSDRWLLKLCSCDSHRPTVCMPCITEIPCTTSASSGSTRAKSSSSVSTRSRSSPKARKVRTLSYAFAKCEESGL